MQDWHGSAPSHLAFFFLHHLHARQTRFRFCGGRAAFIRESDLVVEPSPRSGDRSDEEA